MKRRRMIQSVLGLSAASALPHPVLAQPPAKVDSETPTTATIGPDAVSNGVLHFFDAAGFAALRRLGQILVPARQNAPGALEAEAAEFLDFLIGQSPSDRQSLYRDGAARLNREAQ